MLLVLATMITGQHDPERNAVRLLAKNRPEQARVELDKPAKNRAKNPAERAGSERAFVEMLLELAEGRVDEAIQSARAARNDGLPLDRLRVGPRE